MIKQITCEICLNSFEEKSICPFCGSKIEISINQNTKWAVCYTTNDIMEATHYKAMIEGENIPAEILSQIDTTRMFTIGDLAIVKLMVPSPFLDEAKEIIESLNKDE